MPEWKPYIDRYRGGEWRDCIFRDIVLEDVRELGCAPTLLDIGCGRGLDGSVPLQRSLAEAAGRFIGVEPDPEIVLGDHFTETHRCPFEEVPLPSGSIHLAFPSWCWNTWNHRRGSGTSCGTSSSTGGSSRA